MSGCNGQTPRSEPRSAPPFIQLVRSRIPEAFRSSAFRATFAFALATTVAILAIFGFVY
jgi:hypothetical protein